MFIVNLSMSDFIFSIIMGFPLMTISSFNRKWIFGKVACELYGLVGGVFGLMSINTLAVIAFDRYNVIARPIQASRTLSYRRAFMMLMIVWTWSSTWTVPPLFGWGAYIPEGFQTSCTFDYLTVDQSTRSYILCLYICGFAAPLFIILYCYYHIYKAVAAHEKEMGKMAKKLNAEIRQGQSAKKSEIKTAKIAMTIIITFLLSWTPYATVALIAQFGPQEVITPYVSELPVMFAKASAMHNPLIYALSHPKFRDAVDKRFPWLLCCCGVTSKEREENASTAAQPKKTTVMNRMDSVNSTGAGGAQSQMSEISNLDSDTGVDDAETGQVTSVSMRMKNVQKQDTPKASGRPAGAAAAARGAATQPQQENLAVIKDIINAFANVMTAQAGAQQAQHAQQPQLVLPPQLLATLNQDPQQLQNALFALSQRQGMPSPQNTAQTSTTPSASGPSVSHQQAAAVVTTEAEVNGGVTNKAYQAD
ncbi:rhodopsin [Plakobranchus ocellatus]|uniref:Rhodopsin n=1 Tax=Plakobranchus ocellatus TaxID=259542 RepID=A0AAV4D2S0_9GAST|nr:rhodopsin [Plakobranchus ocellatus]